MSEIERGLEWWATLSRQDKAPLAAVCSDA